MEKRQMDVSVISDLHLGTYGCRAAELLNYLRTISPRILVLNGDIIDIWQFSKRYFPTSHLQIVRELISLLTSGTRVIYITGNHDEVLRRYSDLDIGGFQLTDKLVIEIDHKKTWIFHGDVFDNTTRGAARFWARLGSNGYAVLLAVNRFCNKVMQLMGKEKISLSRRIMNQVNKSIIRIREFENTCAELAIEKKYDYVICGHIHQPEKKKITTAHGTVTYLNSGDWVEHMTALEYREGDWHIYHASDTETQKAVVRELIPQPQVVTDKIGIHLHSLKSLHIK